MKRLTAVFIGLGLTIVAAPPALAQSEQQIGQQVYAQLARRGEIISSSPYYNILNPIAQRIKRVADPQYDTPFRFILVHEKSPNAFSVPGGNVYVTDSMMTFVQNKEELAGVLCHETSHTIHHDVVNLAEKQQNVDLLANIASILLGGRSFANFILSSADQLVGLRFSRDVEHAADETGAVTCAQAGINPWGMVWLFQRFVEHPTGGKPPEALSDHPRDDHRIADLENEFASSPATFGRFSSDIATATPLNQPGFRSDRIRQSSH
ncbi:MAG: M48 family metallopeptidase [Candidatus Eremiobacteraeota bacterium]|nr:M48 family metallopeptidase [Candidatus Eremiobacteraeota bacterium]